MASLHFSLRKESSSLSVDELVQFLQQKFSRENTHIFQFKDDKEVFMFLPNVRNQSFSYFDQIVFESLSRDDVTLLTHDFDENGIEFLANKLRKIINEDDIVSRLSLKRMCRLSNCILVLDDDVLILKTMENVLKSFGHVSVEKDGESFIKSYKEYAPNIVFVDIHLTRERGSDIIKKIRQDIDPDIHAVMISSDGTRDTVLEIKEAGACGFIVKPFNRDTVYKHLLKTPTFVPKKH